MFAKRKSHKPPQDFHLNFKKNFDEIALSPANGPATPAQTLRSTSNEDLGMSFNPSQWDHGVDSKELVFDNQEWGTDMFNTNNFSDVWCQPTPGIDSNAMNFATAHSDMLQMPLDGMMSMHNGLATPISASVDQHDQLEHASIQPSTLDMNEYMASQYHQPAFYNPQQAFTNIQLPGHAALQYPGPPIYKGMHGQSMGLKYDSPLDTHVSLHRPEMDKFRFRVSLLTATAMTKNEDDIPVTYLNKCQTYKLSIRDSTPSQMPGAVCQYRTYVRISFEDEQQREKPATHWQLWKDGRGTNEAHQRGGKLQAVEYVPITQGQSAHRGANVEIQSEAFDGFCVLWTPTYQGQAECEVQVRFNFLSTDFSHSKGVKGIPVRLCAKTEIVSSSTTMAPPAPTHEVSYCRVKLFRDHGAERKIANDESHVKKTIEKLSQQLQQSQTANTMNENGKRRRSDAMASARPGKLPRHKRASSISSNSSNGMRDAAEDDIQTKLTSMNVMLHSRRTESLLYLQGDEQDDPDLFPVTLPGINGAISTSDSPDLTRLDRRSTFQSQPSMESPTPSSIEFNSPSRRTSGLSAMQGHAPANQVPTLDTRIATNKSANPQSLITPADDISKVKASGSAWLSALEVDSNYVAPPAKPQPVACFYIQQKSANSGASSALHRAVYLHKRTLQDFIAAISRKYEVDATAITTILRINNRGLHIELDDEAIEELPEGQEMTSELDFVDSSPFRKLTLRY